MIKHSNKIVMLIDSQTKSANLYRENPPRQSWEVSWSAWTARLERNNKSLAPRPTGMGGYKEVNLAVWYPKNIQEQTPIWVDGVNRCEPYPLDGRLWPKLQMPRRRRGPLDATGQWRADHSVLWSLKRFVEQTGLKSGVESLWIFDFQIFWENVRKLLGMIFDVWGVEERNRQSSTWRWFSKNCSHATCVSLKSNVRYLDLYT